MLWEELLAGQFDEALKRSGGVCLLPLGAMEKHGRHLPLGTDNMIAAGVAKDAAEVADVVVFPTFPFGELLGFQQHPGSVCLSIRLIEDYLTELCDEIGRNGFTKIILLSAHGGNQDIANVIAQRTQESKKTYVVLASRCYNPEPYEVLAYIREKGRENWPELTDEDMANLESFCAQPMDTGHACFGETLALLGVRPELADMSLVTAESGDSTHRFDHLKKYPLYSPYFWAGHYPNHYQGTYHPGANERLAKVLHELFVKKTADMICAVKEDEELLRINAQWNQAW